MSLMSLRESLARSKNKWKKRLHLGSRTASPAPPPVSNEPATSTAEGETRSGDEVKPWVGVKKMLQVLDSSSSVFGPLKSVLDGLNKCIDIYERAAKGHQGYDELRDKIDGLLADLAGHMTQPMDPMMTHSVKLLCLGVESELKKIQETQAQNVVHRLYEAMHTSDEIMDCYRRIHGYLERLTLNANMSILNAINELTTEGRLKGMSPAMSAIYDSTEADDIKRRGCTPGTRQPQINLLLEWAYDPEAGRTCWMNGMAGTGKTTIAYSVCTTLEQASALGASFFCCRIIPECRQVKHIIPTIAYQLARYSLPFRCALDKVLQLNPDARSRALKIQYQKLIIEPLVEAKESLPADFIVVIDALDECENEESLGQILDLLLSTTGLPIRFLVSSRPEPEINRRMALQVGEQNRNRLVLHDPNTDAVKSDIETYMRHELEHVPLTESQWSSLVERCGVLFIYASTACRLVKQGQAVQTLNEAMSVIVGSASKLEHEEENTIDELYSMILMAAFNRSKMSRENRRRMRELLETVICAVEPMALETLAAVLGLEGADQANALLQPLRSVLNVTSTGLVTTLHVSFVDFMLCSTRASSFHCVAANRHGALAESCLQIINGFSPQFNICGLPSSYLADMEVSDIDERVVRSVSPELIYSCRYWSTHLYIGTYNEKLVAVVQKFLSDRLLIWMETLNLTGNMPFGTSIIRNVEKWCDKESTVNDVVKMVRDAGQFVSVYANHPVSQSTPHIYVSMLAFWPRSRPVSIAYMSRMVGILYPMGTAIAQRQPLLLATWSISSGKLRSISLSSAGSRIAAITEGAIYLLDASNGDEILHVNKVQTRRLFAVAISPDGTHIAFGGYRGVYLLDVKNEVFQEFPKPNSVVQSIIFLPDGSRFAFGLSGGDINIYASQQGRSVLGLKGHTGEVWSIATSPDGLFITSGSHDRSVRVWDAKSGQMVGEPLQGHSDSVWSVSYSPDGTRIASASSDRTIRVWDPTTGQMVLGPLKGHSEGVYCVAFSPNGALIASGSSDDTIRVYNAQTGQIALGPLQGHISHINSVIFSPDSAQLYSCSNDGTIRLWNLQDLDVPSSPQPDFPVDFCCAQYSPDGLLVVSGSSDGSVCVWDVQTGGMVLGSLQGHSKKVLAVEFSPNTAYIASASEDATLRIWSAHDGKDLHGPIWGHTNRVHCVCFSPDSTLLASASKDTTLRIWDVKSGQLVIDPLQGHYDTVYSVAFSPDGSQIVSGSNDRTIRVWDIRTGQTVVGPLQGHGRRVVAAQFSPDGSQILSGSWDGSVWRWDAHTGQELFAWGTNREDTNSMSFSPDGLLVAPGSDDKTIQIWDAQTGELILTLEGHLDYVQSVQFSSDGSRVVSCSWDGSIRSWDVASRIANIQLNKSTGEGTWSLANN
ncbi:vegetative incompatibility protein HET-E-1 [Rhizoctonia solani AG-3 Rhs1AP]|uniref:Vegetative incompatibility protein HET-E-1 n=2 Tax=Rhizoctonia solani AG-3 TaxID=1086053 RepID=A0A074SP85_9AGAM|nr:vegetative incompatibility protein HET-E-1 [Rhizoctonia solani AG-3 Rhs1AP]KEP51807.1 vegetative incompatibility protein HET-E-1 [Rhizoctonia solani 123E]